MTTIPTHTMPAVEFERMYPGTPLPRRAHPTDAGVDLTSIGFIDERGTRIETKERISVRPGELVKVRTGIKTAIPAGYVGLLVVRSSLGVKHGLSLANDVGIIDSDYRGEIIVCLRNTTRECAGLQLGERVAQLVVVPVSLAPWVEVEHLDATDRGEGGFGSTGK